MGKVIAVENLQKTYRPKSRRGPIEVKAVDGISFEVDRGEFFGLLGPNGAGKTTNVGVLTTRVLRTGGRALVDGIDVRRDPVSVERRIGSGCAGLRNARLIDRPEFWELCGSLRLCVKRSIAKETNSRRKDAP
jgi:ABC-type multidrug transport system ATPase subunit